MAHRKRWGILPHESETQASIRRPRAEFVELYAGGVKVLQGPQQPGQSRTRRRPSIAKAQRYGQVYDAVSELARNHGGRHQERMGLNPSASYPRLRTSDCDRGFDANQDRGLLRAASAAMMRFSFDNKSRAKYNPKVLRHSLCNSTTMMVNQKSLDSLRA
jgi:hypothetical protein